jgi:hypothetical protein
MVNLKLHFLNYVNRRNIDIKKTTADQGFLCFCDFYKVFSSITQFRDMMIYGSDLQVSPQEFVDQKCHEIDVEKIVLSCARRVYLDDQENSLTELNLT